MTTHTLPTSFATPSQSESRRTHTNMFKIRSSKYRHVFCDQPKVEVRDTSEDDEADDNNDFPDSYEAHSQSAKSARVQIPFHVVAPLTILVSLSVSRTGMLDGFPTLHRHGGPAVHQSVRQILCRRHGGWWGTSHCQSPRSARAFRHFHLAVRVGPFRRRPRH